MAQGAEILQGIFREGDICVLAGWLNVGKSPLIKDWAICIASGLQWCNQLTAPRPVLMIDFEAKEWAFLPDLRRMSLRLGLSGVPPLLTPFIYHNNERPAETIELVGLMKKGTMTGRLQWIREKLTALPNALIMVDPLDTLFPIEKNKNLAVTVLFNHFRELSFDFPQAAFIFVFNLKKADPRADKPNLLVDPRTWLQQTSGAMAILDRSDVRLGLDEHPETEGVLVLHGLRRSEKMEPLLLEPDMFRGPDDAVDRETGFKIVDPGVADLTEALSPAMLDAWVQLESGGVTMQDILGVCRSRSMAYRLKARALALGLLEPLESGEGWVKK